MELIIQPIHTPATHTRMHAYPLPWTPNTRLLATLLLPYKWSWQHVRQHTHYLGHSSLVTGHHQLENLWMYLHLYSDATGSEYCEMKVKAVCKWLYGLVTSLSSFSSSVCLEVNADFSTDLSFCKCVSFPTHSHLYFRIETLQRDLTPAVMKVM